MKTDRVRPATLGLTLILLGACHARAGESKSPPPSSAAAARATIDSATASRIALARVPGGRVQSAELEEEGGRLLYSLDIRPARGTGIEEVQVDAHSGAVIGQSHENPAQEADESRQEQDTATH